MLYVKTKADTFGFKSRTYMDRQLEISIQTGVILKMKTIKMCRQILNENVLETAVHEISK